MLHNDDTTMKVLELMKQQNAQPPDPGESAESANQRTGVFTSGIVSVCGEHRIALFRTGSRHAGENLLALLERRDEALGPPIQMCDALSRNMPKELEALIPYYSERHTVKPGITGWAQISYKYGASVDDAIEKLNYDLFYIKNMSFFMDLVILLKTIKIVLSREGSR